MTLRSINPAGFDTKTGKLHTSRRRGEERAMVEVWLLVLTVLACFGAVCWRVISAT
jgi:hypothetical protein